MTKKIELKGGSFTLSVLHLLDNDLDIAATFLAEKVKQAPAFFESAPLVIDISHLEKEIDFQTLKSVIDNAGMLVVGVSGCRTYDIRQKVKKAGLAVLSAAKQPPINTQKSINKNEVTVSNDETVHSSAKNNNKVSTTKTIIKDIQKEVIKSEPCGKIEGPILAKVENPPRLPSKIISTPVRSGQQIYAKDTDLIILGNVSQGAEIIADGCIHVYGVLRGRAIAGANGNDDAYIFCQNLQPELISVAGHYWLNDAIPEKYISRAVKISLDNDSLNIDNLTL